MRRLLVLPKQGPLVLVTKKYILIGREYIDLLPWCISSELI